MKLVSIIINFLLLASVIGANGELPNKLFFLKSWILHDSALDFTELGRPYVLDH